MDEDVINQYIESMPPQLFKSILALSNKNRWAVYLALLKHEKMYFSEIKELFKAKPQSISYILKDFTDSGLVHRSSASPSDFGNSQRIYYKPTNFGINIVKGLIDSALPKKSETKEEIMKEVMDSVFLKKSALFTSFYDIFKNIPKKQYNSPEEGKTTSSMSTRMKNPKVHYIAHDWDKRDREERYYIGQKLRVR